MKHWLMWNERRSNVRRTLEVRRTWLASPVRRHEPKHYPARALLKRYCSLALVALALTGLAAPWIAHAQEQPGVTLTARAGFDGYYEVDEWLPVRVVLQNDGPGLDGQVEVRLPRGAAAETVYAYPISLPTVSRKEVTLYVRPEGYLGELDVVVVSSSANGNPVARVSVRLKSIGNTDRLFGVLAGSPSAFNTLADVVPPNGTASVAELEPGDLPERAQALNALDVLVVSDVDTGLLTDRQRAALSEWVAGGGQLIVAGGPGWLKTAAGLRDLLPVAPFGTRTLPELTSLQAYVASPYELAGSAVVAAGVLTQDAEALVSQGDTPLIVRRPVGFGAVAYLGADPALAPLKGWDGAADVYRALVSAPADRPEWAGGIQDWSSASDAASTLPNLQLPPTSLICGFLGLYIVAIGPLNFILVRALRRRELAWISVPLLVLAFSGAAFVIGSQARGNQPILNRLAIVQAQLAHSASGTMPAARVSGIVGIFSPNRATYRLRFERALLAHPAPSDSGLAPGGDDWTFLVENDQTTVPDLRMDVAGFTLLAVEGPAPAPALTHDLTLNLDDQGASVQGGVTNNSSFLLRDAVVLGLGQAQRLGDLRPGDTRAVRLSLTALRSPGPPAIDDILGATNYYSDPESRRRYSLLRAMSNSYGVGRLDSGSSAGIYLAGWSDESPLGATLEAADFRAIDTTLYLVSLTPSLAVGQGRLTILPNLFTWSVESGTPGNASPYGLNLYQSQYSLRFSLARPIPFTSVESLTLHLHSRNQAGPSGLAVDLWDYTSGDWASLPDPAWGDIAVPNPGRYVGPGGEIRLRLDSTGNPNAIEIEAADFTLVVTR